jgi:hypothetical protein
MATAVICEVMVCFCVLKVFLKKFKNKLFFYFKLIFLNNFDVQILKIILKK